LISVRAELQARRILEQGDVEEAMNAAAQIGDDALQRWQQGRVVPESFTHGTSTQRQAWFRRGLQGGRAHCNTFDVARL
jgi:predicted metalloprotease